MEISGKLCLDTDGLQAASARDAGSKCGIVRTGGRASSDWTSSTRIWQVGNRPQGLKDKSYNERFRVGQRAKQQNEYRIWKSAQTTGSKGMGSHFGKFVRNWQEVPDKLKKAHLCFPSLRNTYTGLRFITKFTRDNTVTKEIIKIIYEWVLVDRLRKVSDKIEQSN